MDRRSSASCVSSPLRDYLRRAAERSGAEVEKYRNSPVQSEYRSPAFMFARALKARPEFSGLDAEAATTRVDRELDEMFPDHPAPWVALGLPDMDTREEKAMDPRMDFLGVWDSVRTPFDLDTVVDQAARLAKAERIELGGRFSHRNDRSFVELLNLCHCLGKIREGPFYLSCRDAARVLGTNPTTASQLLRRAERTGFLSADKYEPRDRVGRKAKRWSFHVAEETPRVLGR